jgi:hypothetical protein
MLQLFDVLRGWAEFDFGGVIGNGATPTTKIVWPRISKEGAALVAKAVKKASRWRRCVCLSGEPTHESFICGTVRHSLKGLCGVKQPKWHEKILKQAEWRDNCHF